MEATSDWQSQMESIPQRAKYVLDNKKEWSDCSFLLGSCEKKEIQAHKIFLAMASPVFEVMFYGSMAESKFPITVDDINPGDFELLLEYIYSGSVSLNSPDEAFRVHYAADKYIMPGLMTLCIDKIWDFLNPKTACCVYEFAKLNQYSELEAQCLKIISIDTVEVIEDSSFLTIDAATLETILDMDDLSISSELELFNAMLRWADCECRRQVTKGIPATSRSVVNTTLPKVRFLTLKPEVFAKEITNCNLLEESEKYKIIINILSKSENPGGEKERNVPMPEDFSTNEIERREYIQSNTNEKYSWIQILPGNHATQEKISITYIPFQVRKRIKIVGVQMNAQWAKVSDNPANSRNDLSVQVVGVQLQINQKPFSECYLYDSARSNEYIAMNGLDYLERNQLYVIKITSIQVAVQIRSGYGYHQAFSTVQAVESSSLQRNEFSGNVSYFNMSNLPIKSILYL